LNVNATEDDVGWQQRKPHQPSSPASQEQRLHHHGIQQAQQQQQRHSAVSAAWQSASIAAEHVDSDRESEERQRSNSGDRSIHLTLHLFHVLPAC